MAAPEPEASDHISPQAKRFRKRVRSPEDLQRLSDFEDRFALPLMLSAIVPIVTAASRASTDSWVSIIVNVVAWAVFIIDLTVHVKLVRGYLRTGVGIFDLVVVVITAPWFLIPGAGNAQILMLARLARLARLMFVSKGARRAASRLGKVGIFAASMLLFCSWMAYVAEHPTNPEFDTFGDSLWWGVVTLTTVGYGDIVPITEKGRFAGTFLMLTGLATLGLISGTLASLFRLTPRNEPPTPAADTDSGATPLAEELAAVRSQLATLDRRLASLVDAVGDDAAPAQPGGTPG
jgi:voltage-gated potassium channel